MKLYLDNCATTKPYQKALEVFCLINTKYYANVNSISDNSYVLAEILHNAREKTIKLIGANANQQKLHFTTSATYSNNVAIFGIANQKINKDKRFICSVVEHPSVFECYKALETRGYDVKYVGFKDGQLDYQQLETWLKEKPTALVSVMAVNNVTGYVFDVERIQNIASMHGAKYLCDATQAISKIAFDVSKLDMVSFSGHKFGSVKGVGALVCKNTIKLEPLFFGGGQESGLFPSTINLAAICSMTKALECAMDDYKTKQEKLSQLKKWFITELDQVDFVRINQVEGVNYSNFVINISCLGYKPEVLIHYFDNQEIYLSSLSACSSNKGADSQAKRIAPIFSREADVTRVLTSLRVCISYTTTKDDLMRVINGLNQIKEKIYVTK